MTSPEDDASARARDLFEPLRSDDPAEQPTADEEYQRSGDRGELGDEAGESHDSPPPLGGLPPDDEADTSFDRPGDDAGEHGRGDNDTGDTGERTRIEEAPHAVIGQSGGEAPPDTPGYHAPHPAPVSVAEWPDEPDEQHWATPAEDTAATALAEPAPIDEAVSPGGDEGTSGAPEHPPPRELPRVLAIANQKGGVGKTTTAVNLGAALAEIGYRVLVIDLDPQGNATTGLGINTRNLEHSVYDVILHDVPIEDCIEATSLRNLFVVPATIDLAGAEIELVPAFSREQRLRRALQGVGDDFDFTIIDCPPSLGLLTVNGLTAATEILVPIQCEYYALEGLGQLLRNVNLVKGNLNPQLELSTIILTMYDARTKLAEQVANEVREHFGDKVCRTMVPRTVRLSEAPSFGQPVILFDPTSRGAIAYRELAKEVSRGAPQRAR